MVLTKSAVLTGKAVIGKYDRRDWDPIVGQAMGIQINFAEAARKDLGLPRKEINLPLEIDFPAAPEERELLLKMDSILNSQIQDTGL